MFILPTMVISQVLTHLKISAWNHAPEQALRTTAPQIQFLQQLQYQLHQALHVVAFAYKNGDRDQSLVGGAITKFCCFPMKNGGLTII
jgi:hypothetical protein